MEVWDICKIIDEQVPIACDGCGIRDDPLVALGIPDFIEIYLCKNCLKKLLLALELKSRGKSKKQ